MEWSNRKKLSASFKEALFAVLPDRVLGYVDKQKR